MKIHWVEIILIALMVLVLIAICVKAKAFADSDDWYQLSQHFHQSEFNQKAPLDLDLDSFEINQELIIKLEILRLEIGDRPIIITSGYRTSDYNKVVGGVERSQHLTGNAADIVVRDMTPKELQKIAEEVGFSFTKAYKTYLHVDVR